MEMGYAVVLTSGSVTDPEFYQQLLEGAEYIIAADGGATIATRLGFRPTVLIGDFDSLAKDELERLRAQGVEIIRHPVEKDKTDSHLAVEYALGLPPATIILLGPLQGRLDHVLANVGLLFTIRQAGKKGYLMDEIQCCQLAERKCVIQGRPGQLLSLVPLSPLVTGVSTKGLGYPLQNASLHQGETLGISNFFVEAEAEVTVGSGDLLIVQNLRDDN